MKVICLKYCFFTLFLIKICCCNYLIAQIPDTLWTRLYGGSGYDRTTCVIQSNDGGYVIFGDVDRDGNDLTDIQLFKTDSGGNLIWTKTYGTDSCDWARSGVQTQDGGYVIAGATEFPDGKADIYVIKTSSNGDTIWSKRYGEHLSQFCYSIKQTHDKGFLLAGQMIPQGEMYKDIYLIKTDSLGDTVWTRRYGGLLDDYSWSAIETHDSCYIVTGVRGYHTTSDDLWFIKLDQNGDILWSKQYGGTGIDRGLANVQLVDGSYAVTGRTSSFGSNSTDVWLLRLDENGDTLWTKLFGGADLDIGRSVVQTINEGLVIAGYTYSYGSGLSDIYIIRTNELGEIMWTKLYGGSSYDASFTIGNTTDGGYIIGGYTASFGLGDTDIWLLKIAPDSFAVAESNQERVPNLDIMITPNPFHEALNIMMPSGYQSMTITIYDVTGCKQTSIVPTSRCVLWDGRDDRSGHLPTGVYFIHIEMPEQDVIKKVVKIQ